MNLELALEWIENDELVEVTPTNIRIRKKYLDPTVRKRIQAVKKLLHVKILPTRVLAKSSRFRSLAMETFLIVAGVALLFIVFMYNTLISKKIRLKIFLHRLMPYLKTLRPFSQSCGNG